MFAMRHLQGSLILMIFVSTLFSHGILGVPTNLVFGSLAILCIFVPIFLVDSMKLWPKRVCE